VPLSYNSNNNSNSNNINNSAHHLKQVYWFMETSLGVTPENRATAEDMDGIFTPEALI